MAGKEKVKKKSRYEQLIEAIFFSHYRKGVTQFEFRREEIEEKAKQLGVELPKNLGDVIYSFRYRSELPEKIRHCAPAGTFWLIQPAGRSKYQFRASTLDPFITPNPQLAETKVPDATPGIISKYALDDEQALLAKLRYN